MEEEGEDGVGGRGKCVQPLLADLMNLIGTRVTATITTLPVSGVYSNPPYPKHRAPGRNLDASHHSGDLPVFGKSIEQVRGRVSVSCICRVDESFERPVLVRESDNGSRRKDDLLH